MTTTTTRTFLASKFNAANYGLEQRRRQRFLFETKSSADDDDDDDDDDDNDFILNSNYV